MVSTSSQTRLPGLQQRPYIDGVGDTSVHTPLVIVIHLNGLVSATIWVQWHSSLPERRTANVLAWYLTSRWITRIAQSHEGELDVHRLLVKKFCNQQSWMSCPQLACFSIPGGFGPPLSFRRLEDTSGSHPFWLIVERAREMQGFRPVLYSPLPQCISGNNY